MKETDISRYAFLIVFLVLGYFSFLVVKSLLSYLLFSVVLVMLFHPIYKWLHNKTGKPRLASIMLVFLLILVLVLPSIAIGLTLLEQAPAAYESFVSNIEVDALDNLAQDVVDEKDPVSKWVTESTIAFREYIVGSAPSFLSSASEIILGLFIMFFVMYFLFIEGDNMLERLIKLSPLNKKHTQGLLNSIDRVVHGVIEGQVLTGLAQGFIAWIAYWALSLPNPLFWGFVTAIFSMIPFIGSPIIWVPASIWFILEGSLVKGIILLGVGALVIGQVDNLLRPIIMGKTAQLHPALVIVGIIGGLSAFGVVGFLVGPLVLALFMAFMRFYGEEAV